MLFMPVIVPLLHHAVTRKGSTAEKEVTCVLGHTVVHTMVSDIAWTGLQGGCTSSTCEYSSRPTFCGVPFQGEVNLSSSIFGIVSHLAVKDRLTLVNSFHELVMASLLSFGQAELCSAASSPN